MNHINQEMQYHGTRINAPYFEGWYFKVTDEQVAFAVIVGIAKHEHEQHAFIQTINTSSKKTRYVRYDIEDVHMEEEPFFLCIKTNIFSAERLLIQEGDIRIDIHIEEPTPLRYSTYSPTIMGPFSYIKNMQCVHSILSLHHKVSGTFCCEEQEFTINGIGYMEKDRGISFPKEYLWVQSNASEIEPSCFFLSIAHIPIAKVSFTGCICVLMVKGRQYRFATYYGVRIRQFDKKVSEHYTDVDITLTQWSYCLKIHIRQYAAYPLLAPEVGSMEAKVFESLEAEVDITLMQRGKQKETAHFLQAGCELRISSPK